MPPPRTPRPPSPRPRPFTPRTAGLKIRRRYHFGTPGLVYVFVTVLIALGAFNSQNNLLFWAFGFALALLIISGLLSGAMLMGLEVIREHVASASAGEPAFVHYRVRNTNRLVPAFALTIEESAGVRRRLSRARPPTWPAHLGPVRAFVVHVGPRETVRATATTRALKRGEAGFGAVTVTTGFPFGLIRKSLDFPQRATALVRPALLPLRADVLSNPDATGEAPARSRRAGPGDEFFSLRDYVPGDTPRSIAWRASAKRGQLLVRQNTAPSPMRLWVVLRLRVLAPADPEADERAISLAGSLARDAASRGYHVGLAAPLLRLHVPPQQGRGHAERLLDALARLDLGAPDARGRTTPFPAAAGGTGGRNSLVLVVHPGSPDRAFGPRSHRISHLSTDRLETYAGTPSSPEPKTATASTASSPPDRTPRDAAAAPEPAAP